MTECGVMEIGANEVRLPQLAAVRLTASPQATPSPPIPPGQAAHYAATFPCQDEVPYHGSRNPPAGPTGTG
jgi:hypothetical protein